MALFRSIKNTLFGYSSDPESLGRNNRTSQMLGAKLAKSSKLISTDNDLPPDILDIDPLTFKYFTYPHDLDTLSNGHYIKFDIYENNLSKMNKTPSIAGAFDPKGISAGVSDVVSADTAAQLLGYGDAKTDESASHVAGNKDDPGDTSSMHIHADASTKRGRAQNDLYEKNYARAQDMKKNMGVKPANAVNMDNHSHTHAHNTSASIILYTPSQNKFVTAANYENAETGFLADFIGDSNIFEAISTVLAKVGGGAVTAALEIAVPGAGGFFNRRTGMAVNPNMELAFKSVPFRPFNFDFQFAPKNRKELDSVHKIIQMFRFHMSPALMGQTAYFAAPSQFELTYMYRGNNNNYIPKIAKCVLENMDVDYSPKDKFTTLKSDNTGASPQLIDVTLQFKEMSIITKQSISEGY